MSDQTGGKRRAFSMADVSAKPVTSRRALASGLIHVGETAYGHLEKGSLPKGNALQLAEVAGMQAAKLTPMLLPLCHPISLSRVAIYTVLRPQQHAVEVFALTEISERTGVEMEALTAVSVALLTIWDLVKPVNPALDISAIRLLYKAGGKRGEWRNPQGLPAEAEQILSGA